GTLGGDVHVNGERDGVNARRPCAPGNASWLDYVISLLRAGCANRSPTVQRPSSVLRGSISSPPMRSAYSRRSFVPRPPDRREIGASSFENMISTESFAEGRYHSGAKRTRTWMWQGGRPCRAMLWTASRTNWRTGPTWRESRMNRGAHASGSQ